MNTQLHYAEGVRNGTRLRNPQTNGSPLKSAPKDGILLDLPSIERLPERPVGRDTPAQEQRNAKETRSQATPLPNRRQLISRCVRLVAAGALLSGAGFYTREVVDQAISEQAYINGEITCVRTPIAGQVRLGITAGKTIPEGANLFAIENTRFGNQEVAAQLNWATETAERLQAEAEEAALRFQQQSEIYRIHEKLYAEQVLSRLALLEEETKLAVAQTAMTHKKTLAAQADARSLEIKRQVDLQRTALVKMPFDGVAWAVPAKNGAEVSTHETVVELLNPKRIWVDAFFSEKQAQKLAVGRAVEVRSPDGTIKCDGIIEWVQAGVGRIPSEGTLAVPASEYNPKRVAVRVQLRIPPQLGSTEFYGVGRNVVVTLSHHE